MSNMDLQRVTESMSYIGHASNRSSYTRARFHIAAAATTSQLAKPHHAKN